ncbi:type II secretion system protein GspD [Aliarcobacter butzleri]|uniref:type II secretion system protein GspD n=1 Tax=Aliarcobacter butzleri TaxID=28197 RepID=UPI003AF7674B
MKQIIYSILLILAINSNIFASKPISLHNLNELLEINLKDLTVEILTSNNLPFVIDKDINIDLVVFYRPEDTKNISFLGEVLSNNGFKLDFKNNIYYIKKKDTKEDELLFDEDIETEPLEIQRIKLNYLNITDIESILKLDDIQYSYLKNVNEIYLKTTTEKFNKISNLIKSIDTLPKQQKIKVSILETNLGKLKEYESLINATFSNSQKFLFDIILGSPLNLNNNSNVSQIKSVFSFLKTNNITNTITDTIINLENNEDFDLISSQNIPFLTTQNTLTDVTTNEINRYEYRDVGLDLKLKPIITDDFLTIDLKFSFSQLLDSNNDRPITTKKALNQKFSINKDKKYFLLSGINNFSSSNKNEKVPFLGDIPILGNLFKNEYINHTFTTTTILIEFIEDTIDFELNEKQLIEKYFNEDCWFSSGCDSVRNARKQP